MQSSESEVITDFLLNIYGKIRQVEKMSFMSDSVVGVCLKLATPKAPTILQGIDLKTNLKEIVIKRSLYKLDGTLYQPLTST